MCRTRKQIEDEDVLVSELNDHLSELDEGYRRLFTKVLKQTYVNSEYNEGQIKDLRYSVDSLADQMSKYIKRSDKFQDDNPNLFTKFKDNTLAVTGVIFMMYGVLFFIWYTFLAILGYEDLLKALFL